MINARRPDFSNHPASRARAQYDYGTGTAARPVTVSILTPFFNTQSEVFRETWVSILNQSFQEWEWLIVDDGSTDEEALNNLASIAECDSRIRVFHEKNRGPAAARNTAFANSVGRYVCLLDSDDLLEPTFLEKMVWFLESYDNFAFSNSWSVNFGSLELLWSTGFERGKGHISANSGPLHSVIRREAYAGAGGFNEDVRFGHEDWEFWLAMAAAGFWGHTIPEYLEWYRKSTDGRHHETLGNADRHRKFQKYIRDKYKGLGERFPNPRIVPPAPYETVETDLPFENLIGNPLGRQRIMFVIPWMVTGGADRVNLDWLRGLIANGYQATICTTLKSENEWFHEFSALTPDIFVLANFLRRSDYPRFLAYLIRSRGIQTVLISNSTIGYHLLPFLRANCPNVAFVDLAHVQEPHWWNGGHPRFAVGYQDMLDLNIVTTRSLRDWMGEQGADLDRVEVCYSGISADTGVDPAHARISIRQKFDIPDQLPMLVFAGRMCEQKRPFLLAEVLRDLRTQGVAFHCVIIGDGELRLRLSKLVRFYGLRPSVTMLGTVTHREWLGILGAADILFLPSLYEGISVALYEAMVGGVVPVMSAVGGQAELVTSDCGVLVAQSVNERQEYVSALRQLIEHPERREELGRNCRQRIHDGYTLDHAITRLLTVLERARTLAGTHPRVRVTPPFGRELAVQAVEYARMTVHEPIPSGLSKVLSWVRTYKVGRVLLRMRLVRIVGQAVVAKIRYWRL